MQIPLATLLLFLALITTHSFALKPEAEGLPALLCHPERSACPPESWREGSAFGVGGSLLAAQQDDDPPQLKRNEELALHRTKRILQSLGTYHKRYGEFPRGLAQLGPPQDEPPSKKAARLISWQLASGKSDGYRYAYKFRRADEERPEGYELRVRPEKYATTGRVAFFANDSGAIHSTREDREPSPDDPAIEQKQQ